MTSPPRSKTASRSASRRSPASPFTRSRPTLPDPAPLIPCKCPRIAAHPGNLTPVQPLHRLSSGKFHSYFRRVSLMRKSFHQFVCAAVALALALPAGAAPPATDPSDAAMESIRPEAIRAHMNFLADDLLEGRGANSRGYEISARYMATEFESMGLTPR